MSLVLTLAVLAMACGGALAIALYLRPRPLPLALPLAFAVLVAYEGVVLPLLSSFRAVTPLGLGVAQLPLVAMAFLGLSRMGPGFRAGASELVRRLAWGLRPRWLFTALLVLAIFVVLSGLLYPPNTWDSMSYHLARVAHWIMQGSVGVILTWIARQSFFPPGAEYLLLLPQGMAGTDRLAFLVQFSAWATLIVSAPAVARSFGAPRAAAAAAALLVATLPMGVLQAASTQNDLVASVTAVAVVVAVLPFAHARRLRTQDALAVGITLAAAWLVKPTALVVVLPFLVWSLVAGARGGVRSVAGRLARSAAVAAVPAGLVVAAEVMRRFPLGFPVIESQYLYPLFGEWTDRFAHSLRALGHHLPISDVLATVTPALVSPTGSGVGDGPEPFRPHEDYAGNPVHALLFLAALLTAAVRWRVLPARAKVPPVALLTSWFLVHALLRENAWFSRLETPLFMLAPAALCVLARGARPIRRAVPVAVIAVAVLLLAHAFLFSALNELRPLSLYPPDTVASYYRARPELQPFDDATLAIARSRNCRRLGVSFDGKTGRSGYSDPWDYPLLWRARAQGIEVRHVTGENDWPCLILCMYCTPSEPSHGGWVRLGTTFLFARGE